MNNECGDNRYEIIDKAKSDILSATNIEESKDEMGCLDNFLFRCWQMGWLKGYEPTEKQNEESEEGWGIEAWKICVQVFVVGLVFSVTICGGAVISGIISRHIRKAETVTVAEQHESIMLDHDYLYCPFCGEKIGEEE